MTAAIGSDRTGLRLSPVNGATANALQSSDLPGQFTTAIRALAPFNLAFIHAREIWHTEDGMPQPLVVTPLLRQEYKGALIANDQYDFVSASDLVAAGAADAVAFGRPFLANPDLVERFQAGAALNAPDPATFYSEGAKGYTDYPRALASRASSGV